MAVIALFLLVATFTGSWPAAAATTNPAWPAKCPQRVVIVLDLSSSISPYLPEVKKSATDLVDALRGAPNEVAVVTFGTAASVAVPLLDVGNDAERARLKELVDRVGLGAGDGGATNWEEALHTAEALDPGVVLFLTDGEPTAHGTASTGYSQSTDNLTPAVQVADRMRRDGTRIVGVGMGLQSASIPNLVQVTGPVAGDDYYETGSDAVGLLDKLYDVAGKTCGIPVTALPQPEGGGFPVVPVVVGTLGLALAIGVVGYLRSRRRHVSGRPAPGPAAVKPERLKNRAIRAADVDKFVSDVAGTPPGDAADRPHDPGCGPRAVRSRTPAAARPDVPVLAL